MWQSIKNSSKTFASQLLSIDESRKSIVVIVFLILSIFSIYKLYKTGDIPSNAMTAMLTFSALIFGNNAIASVTGVIGASRNGGQYYSPYGSYGNYNSYNYGNYSNPAINTSTTLTTNNNQNVNSTTNNDLNGSV